MRDWDGWWDGERKREKERERQKERGREEKKKRRSSLGADLRGAGQWGTSGTSGIGGTTHRLLGRRNRHVTPRRRFAAQ